MLLIKWDFGFISISAFNVAFIMSLDIRFVSGCYLFILTRNYVIKYLNMLQSSVCTEDTFLGRYISSVVKRVTEFCTSDSMNVVTTWMERVIDWLKPSMLQWRIFSTSHNELRLNFTHFIEINYRPTSDKHHWQMQ